MSAGSRTYGRLYGAGSAQEAVAKSVAPPSGAGGRVSTGLGGTNPNYSANFNTAAGNTFQGPPAPKPLQIGGTSASGSIQRYGSLAPVRGPGVPNQPIQATGANPNANTLNTGASDALDHAAYQGGAQYNGITADVDFNKAANANNTASYSTPFSTAKNGVDWGKIADPNQLSRNGTPMSDNRIAGAGSYDHMYDKNGWDDGSGQRQLQPGEAYDYSSGGSSSGTGPAAKGPRLTQMYDDVNRPGGGQYNSGHENGIGATNSALDGFGGWGATPTYQATMRTT